MRISWHVATTHFRRWTLTWLLVATCGVGLGMFAWGPVKATVTVLIVAAVAASVVAVADSRLRHVGSGGTSAARPPAGFEWRRWRRVVTTAVSLALAVVGGAALFGFSSALAWGLLVLAALTSPWTWRAVGRWTRWQPVRGDLVEVVVETGGDGAEVAAPTEPTEVRAVTSVMSLTDQELCREFRRSFVLLSQTTLVSERMHLVALREAYLDEMARRDPAGFQFWIESGARAASGPEKYWRRPPQTGRSDAA